MKSFFPDFKNVVKLFSWVVILGLIGGLIYLSVVTIQAYDYRAERIVERMVSLIENPTQTVTDEEKKELELITQNGFLVGWGNENNLKTLRRISQGNPIKSSSINYTGDSGRIATTNLTFSNNLKNENSKTAKLYLERYGNWWSGIKWRIFQIDMPQEDSIIDDTTQKAKNIKDSIQNTIQNSVDQIKDTLNQ